MLKQTRRNRFLHIDGWLYQGLRSRLARHGPIGGIALRPSSFVRDGWSRVVALVELGVRS